MVTQVRKRDHSKLPKWVQLEIEGLKKGLEFWVSKFNELGVDPEDAPITFDVSWDVERGLPKGTHITFKIAGGEVEVYEERGLLHVRSDGGVAKVCPQASNHFYVEVGG